MKFNTSVFLATTLLPCSSLAFTPSHNVLRVPNLQLQTKYMTPLHSTVLKQEDALPTAKSNEEQKPLPGMDNIAMMEESKKSYLDDGFVFGLDGSGLERPKGKQANIVVEGDSLETTPQQVGIVSATFLGQFLFAAHAISQLYSQTDDNVALTAAASLSTLLASYILADFGSGVLHWSVDNYGNGPFQGHHSAPWTITYRGFCNNVWKLCIPFGIPTVGAISYLAGDEHPLVFCFTEIMSQELHKWSHMTVKETPALANTLQDLGLIISRVPHAQHHMAPYDGNYCIVSGICNEPLDNSGFFRWMEHQVYKMNGVESNAWKLDPELRERTLRGEYQLQK
ncbi:hypothetical protein ACHAXN_010684 [Cyclotella atomus]